MSSTVDMYLQEGAQAVSCAELALKCLAAGLRGESSSQAECSGLTTEWINRQYSPQYSRDSALLASKAWAELLKVTACAHACAWTGTAACRDRPCLLLSPCNVALVT